MSGVLLIEVKIADTGPGYALYILDVGSPVDAEIFVFIKIATVNER
jgi:hypothetical protein